MPLYTPYVRMLDAALYAPLAAPPAVQVESASPTGYVSEQQGVKSESETVVTINNGEALSTSEGDYVLFTEVVPDPFGTYIVEVLRQDIGAGSYALETVTVEDHGVERAAEEYERQQEYQTEQPESETYVEPFTTAETAVQNETVAYVSTVGEAPENPPQDGGYWTTDPVYNEWGDQVGGQLVYHDPNGDSVIFI